MAGNGADWFARRLGAPAPAQQGAVSPPVASPPGMVPYGYQQGPAPGQAYYQPAPVYQQPVQQGYQPAPPGAPQGFGPMPGVTAQGYYPGQDEGLLQERPSSLLIAARSAQATGGSHGAQEHMRTCEDCGGTMYVATRRWKGEDQTHAHCYNCGAQEGARDGSVVSAARAGGNNGGRVAPSRQYDPETHTVTVDAANLIGPKGTMVTYQPNRREA